MIVSERVFIDVGLEIFGANGMIYTTNTTLYERPETLNTVSVDFPTSIYFIMVVNSKMFDTEPREMVISGEFVSIESGIPINIVNHEGDKGMSLNIGDNLCCDFTIPLYSTKNLRLALCTTPTLTLPLN